MDKKYYAVKTMCGHVGNGKYIEVVFPIRAESRKEAAFIGRKFPRVKHHNKNAILDVTEVTEETYQELLEKNNKDPYLKCQSIQEQNRECKDIFDKVHQFYLEKEYDEEKRNARITYKQKKTKILEKSFNEYFRNLSYEAVHAA